MPQRRSPQDGSSTATPLVGDIVVASATFRDVDTDRREALADKVDDIRRRLPEHVLLHTCHRVELIAYGDADAMLPHGLRRDSGLPAIERVLLVASGLDSAVLAEEQVLGQVREAYDAGLREGTSGAVTNELLRRAIRFGKRVQSFAQPIGDRSLADRALQWLDTQRSGRPAGNAVVLGTGQVARTLAAGLAARGLCVTVASGSLDRAADVVRDLPQPHRHTASSTTAVLDGALDADIVALAQRSGTRIEQRHVASNSLLVVDLSTPAAVEPEAAAALGARLLDLDAIGFGGGPRRLTASAERRLRREARAEAEEFAAWLSSRAAADAIGQLRAGAEDVRRRHVARFRRRHSLPDSLGSEVEAMTVALVRELLHEPTMRLRHVRNEAAHGPKALRLE